jgi:hypothetical protein
MGKTAAAAGQLPIISETEREVLKELCNYRIRPVKAQFPGRSVIRLISDFVAKAKRLGCRAVPIRKKYAGCCAESLERSGSRD